LSRPGTGWTRGNRACKGDGWPFTTDTPNPYLERFYFDTAQGFSAAQLQAATEYVPAQHLLLGTDASPVINLYADDNADVVPLPQRELPHAGDPAPGLSEVFNARERARIGGINALKLLPSLATRISAGA
jgi:predicted TIM-barrel fold metal-dependent hydrolase